MEIEQLRYFLGVVEYGKFVTAAENLFLSQSSLSKQISALEKEVGVRLLLRGRGRVELTVAGETFLPFAQEICDQHRRMVLAMSRFDASARQLVTLGTLPLLGCYDLSSMLAEFSLEHRHVQVDVLEREQDHLVHSLSLAQADLAVLRTDYLPEEDFVRWPLIHDEVVLVAPGRHPFAGRRQLDLRELDGVPMIVMHRQSALSKLVADVMHGEGLMFNPILRHSRHEPLLTAVHEGLGVALMPSRLVRDVHWRDLVTVPLRQQFTTELSLVRPAGSAMAPSVAEFWDFVVERFPHPLRFGGFKGEASNSH
ncbi:LysR family transcriptional regulator [uncultured Tessaracoccus sp.]|uniref:LysR family transcriptional regulator n=1 Tax=uncultured Tessaracoccus sp. TaxID=905023 RepID=UPI0025FB96E2|nr:LysR family transcriptional regulator [uncultured Tessaracoccus sp.]